MFMRRNLAVIADYETDVVVDQGVIFSFTLVVIFFALRNEAHWGMFDQFFTVVSRGAKALDE